MKKLMAGLMLVSLLWLGGGQAVLAENGEPVGGCPPSFKLHHVHGGEHWHDHIGSDYDKNGDGYLCVKHPADKHHLHVDNNVRKK